MSTHLIPEGKKTMQSILAGHDPKIVEQLTKINVSRIKEILKGKPATGSESHRLTAAARSLDFERPAALDMQKIKFQYKLFAGN